MRCAIYTRKSVDERAIRELSSLDNQRDYCSAFIASQGGNGWTELPDRYDDSGWSGGTLDRPALARLRADIAARKVDTVIVYKIDRLSRSLRDFANLVAEFERCGTTFVSVTQSFDTGTAMGRLTLNVLLSFAQFERELTGERLRDYFGAATKRGLWITGKRPFGYQIVDQRLQIDPIEADVVRYMYRTYPRIMSIREVANDLNRRGLRNRNGTAWTDQIVHKILRNRIYRGERRGHEGRMHAPLVTERQWQLVKDTLAAGHHFRRRKNPSALKCLLQGIIVDRSGRLCSPHGRDRNGHYRYYAECTWRTIRPERMLLVRVVDAIVVGLLDRLLGTANPEMRTYGEALELVARMVDRVEADERSIAVTLKTGVTIRTASTGHYSIPVAKRWLLVSPEGERLDIYNLSLWLRTNAHRFSARDMLPADGTTGPPRAHLRLGRLRPEARPRREEWNGWRWQN